MDENRRSLAKETLKSTAGKILMAVTRFGTAIIFAQYLGPAVFGAAYLLFRLGNVGSQVIVGWGDAAKKRLSEPTESDASIAGTVLTVAGLWGGTVFVISWALSDVLLGLVAIQQPGLLLGGFVAAESLAYAVDKLLEGQGRVGAASLSRASRFVLAVPFQLWLLSDGNGGASLLAGYIIAAVIVGSATFVSLDISPSFPSYADFRSQWTFGRYAVPNALLGTLYGSLDLVLLSSLSSTAAAGWYEAAWTLTMPAVFVAAAAASRLMVDVSTDRANASMNVSLTMGYSSILAVPLVFGAVVIAPELVEVVFGAGYEPAAPFLLGLAAFQLLRTKVAPLLQVSYGLDRPGIVTRMTVVTVLVNVVAGAILIFVLGPIGVVVATIGAESVRLCWLAYSVRRELNAVTLLSRPFGIQIVSGLVMFTVLSAGRIVVPPASTGRVLGFLCIGGFVYGLGLLTLDSRVRATARQVKLCIEDSI